MNFEWKHVNAVKNRKFWIPEIIVSLYLFSFNGPSIHVELWLFHAHLITVDWFSFFLSSFIFFFFFFTRTKGNLKNNDAYNNRVSTHFQRFKVFEKRNVTGYVTIKINFMLLIIIRNAVFMSDDYNIFYSSRCSDDVATNVIQNTECQYICRFYTQITVFIYNKRNNYCIILYFEGHFHNFHQSIWFFQPSRLIIKLYTYKCMSFANNKIINKYDSTAMIRYVSVSRYL